jgi:hypothetical protein
MVTLTGSGADSYVWTGSVTDGVAFAPTVTDTYTVTGTDVNGCSNTANVTVTVNALPNVQYTATPATVVCEGTAITLSGSGASTYSWTGGINDGVAFTPVSSMNYTVTGTDANGCSNTAEVPVVVNPLPVVTGSAAVTEACASDGAVALSGSPAGGTWTGTAVSGNQFDPSTAGAGTFDLIYTYSDANACSATDTVTITVDICLGVNETAVNSYNVYPNPNNGTFTLAVNSNAGDVVIEMVDLSGRVVYSANENNVQSGFTTQIVTENLAAGTYMLRVISANEQQVIRISVQ